jgi:hypothetical protein
MRVPHFYCECAYRLVDHEGLALLADRLARLRPPCTLDYEQSNLVAPNATPVQRLLRAQFGRNRELNGGDVKKPATKIWPRSYVIGVGWSGIRFSTCL